MRRSFVCLTSLALGVCGLAQADLNDGLVAYYPFNGNANDESGNGNDGGVDGATLVKDRNGNNESAYNFPEGSKIRSRDLADSRSISFSLWFRINEFPSSTRFLIFEGDDAGGRDTALDLQPDSLSFLTKLGDTVALPSSLIELEQWHHVAAVADFESKSKSIWLDGNLIDQVYFNRSANVGYHHNLIIGAFDDGTTSYGSFIGDLDDIRVYDRGLTDDEITQLAEKPLYQIIEGNFTWQEAKEDAEAKGGRLAVLDTQEKIDAANAYLEDLESYYDLWIGLEGNTNAWLWITGGQEANPPWYNAFNATPTTQNAGYIIWSSSPETPLWNALPKDTRSHYLLEILDRTPAPPVIKLDSFYESNLQEEIVVDATPKTGFPQEFTFQWSFNDQPIPAFLGGALPTFNLLGDQSQDGTWKVVVSNTVGTTEASFEYRMFVDNDSDGLSNYREENITLTNPDLADSDADGLSDPDELSIHGTDPNIADVDEDGLNDSEEIAATTDPSVADTDNDGLLDGAEVKTYASNPKSGDTDNDGIADAAEVAAGLDINTAESIADAVAFLTQELANRPTLEEVKDGRLGSVLLLPDAQTNIVRLRFCIEESDELGQWITREEEAEVEIPLDPNKKFFRFSVKEDE